MPDGHQNSWRSISKEFKTTQNLLSITDHDFDNFEGGKGCYLDNFSSESGKIMICAILGFFANF